MTWLNGTYIAISWKNLRSYVEDLAAAVNCMEQSVVILNFSIKFYNFGIRCHFCWTKFIQV